MTENGTESPAETPPPEPDALATEVPPTVVVPPTLAEPAALRAWLAAQPPADEQIAAAVRARLPAEWDANTRVVLVRNSFVLVLHDALGIQHVLRAELLAPVDGGRVTWSADHGFVARLESLLPEASRPEEIAAEFHPLAQGHLLGFSYFSVSPSTDADTLARYHTVAKDLLAIEPHLATTLHPPRPPLPQQSEFDLSAYPPTDDDIAAMIRTRLPAEWRADTRVVQVHGSFALGHRDASGVQHVLRAEWLDAGLRQRSRGKHLEASHIMLPREAVPLDRYGNLTADFLAAEDALSQALLTPTPGARWSASQSRTALSDDPLTTWVRELLAPVNAGKATWPADESFVAQVKGLLPEESRAAVVVVLAAGGFAVGFHDPAGHRHMVRVLRPEGVEAEFRPLAHGRSLGFSYLPVSSSPTDTATLTRYSAIARGLLAIEQHLLTTLHPSLPQQPEFDLSVYPPIDEGFAAMVRTRLPAEWLVDTRVVQVHDSFALGHRDASGIQHVLRAEWLDAGLRQRFRGNHLEVSHLMLPKEAAPQDRYSNLTADYLAAEATLSEALLTSALAAEAAQTRAALSDDSLTSWVRELLAPGNANEGTWSADARFVTRVKGMPPEESRAKAMVVLAANGFAVGFHDPAGNRHMIRALRPERVEAEFHPLAHGRSLGFSYLSVSPSTDADTLARYRAVAMGLLAIEPRLANTLRPPPSQQPEFDLSAYPPLDDDIAAVVRTRLPAEWRADTRVVQVHGSFALGHRDASGLQHVLRTEWLDAGLRQRSRGKHLEASHLMLPREAPLLGRYGKLTEDFLAAEDALSQSLLTPTPGARWSASQTRAALSNDPLTTWVRELLAPVNAGKATWSADESFVAQVKDMLPEESRAEVVVVLAAGGFAVGFHDPAGHRHMIRVLRPEGVEAEFRPLAHGRSLGFSYLSFASSPDAGTLARYRAIAKGLLAIEQHLLTTLHPPLPQQPEFDLSVYPPIDEGFATMVRTRLPAEWRADTRVVQVHDSFALGHRDASGIQHVLRAEWLDAGLRQRFRGNHLEVSHLMLPKEAAPQDRYSNLTGGFLAAEAAFSQALLTSALAAEAALSQTRAPLSDNLLTSWVRELLAPGNADEGAWSADEHFVARVMEMLPEESRAEAVVLLAANGFAVGFHDPAGNRHMIRALRPEKAEAEFYPLAHGRSLGFSYLSVASSTDAGTLARYRAIAKGLLAIEQRLATTLRPPPSQQPEFDLSAYPLLHEDIAAHVRARLPARWRTTARVMQVHDSFAVELRDASGIQHVLRVGRLEPGYRQGLRGNHLEVSHIMLPREAALPDRYSNLTADFIAAEDALSQALLTPAVGTRWDASQTRAPLSDDPLTTRVRELLAPVNAGQATWSADERFVAQVKDMLPEESRAEAVVVLAAGGFAVGFHDLSGNRHTLRVLRPEGVEAEFRPLAHGGFLGISYLSASSSPANAVTLALYTPITEAILADEDGLLTVWYPQEVARDTKPRNFVQQLSGRLSGVTLRGVDPATEQAMDFDISVDHSAQQMTWAIRASLFDVPLGLIRMSLPKVLAAFAEPVPPGTATTLQGDDHRGQPRIVTFRVAPAPANTVTIGICARGHADPLASALIPYADMDRLGGLLFDPTDKSSARKHG